MTMSPRLRTLSLTAHVTVSVGWLGAVAGAFVLAVAGMTSSDAQTVRAAYLALELIAWFAIVPLAFASLLTGLVQSLGTAWGLFRHYWILAKLSINVFATVVLLLYMQTLDHLADVATETAPSADDVSRLESPSPAFHAGAALLLLLIATALAVHKPRGMTPYGWRKQHERRATSKP
jgi:uncharacterized membrane protein